VCDCEYTVDVVINYILWMARQYRVKENEGSRSPPWYSAWRLMVLSLLSPAVAPAFFLSSRPVLPCPPPSRPWFSSCSLCCPCLSCLTCILRATVLSPVSVMRAAFVVVLVPACNPVACCACSCRRHVPALVSPLCLPPDGVLIPICSPSRTLSPFAGQAGHTLLCVLRVTWRRHVSPSPAMLEAWSVKPSRMIRSLSPPL